MDVVWNPDRTVTLDPPPKRTRKVTGTRFASILGLNRWSTPFQTWCEITGAYRVPFEDTKYTLAGKAIEPLQLDYLRKAYGMEDLVSPEDVYGKDPFKKTYGNFFDDPVFGGMWDALIRDPDTGRVCGVVEFKTTKRAEDWADGVPEYYALQAALYAWLLHVDQVVMVASFLGEGDYDDPGSYVPSSANTAVIPFSMAERYPRFEADYVEPAAAWWAEHVRGGTSPAYDERADAEYLDGLRTAHPDTREAGVDGALAELARLMAEQDAADAACAGRQRRIKALKDELRRRAEEAIAPGQTSAAFHGHGLEVVLATSTTYGVDEDRLKEDGLFERYAVPKTSSRLTVRRGKEND